MSRELRETIPPLPASRESLSADVLGAQSRGELALRFSPRIALVDGRVAACEAAFTWEHPTHGPLDQRVLVSLLRDIGRLDRFEQLSRVAIAAHVQRWPRHAAAPRLAIRVHLEDLVGRDFEERFRDAFRVLGLAIDNLDLLVSARVLGSGAWAALRALGSLRASGARIVLVDPLSCIRLLVSCASVPADALRLPASLVTRLEYDAKALADIRVLAGVSLSLGLELHAEGVTTEAQEDRLLLLDVRQVEGPLHARPLDGVALDGWLRARAESGSPPRRSSWPADQVSERRG